MNDAPKTDGLPAGVVVICDRKSPSAAPVEAYLHDHNLPHATWYAPRDGDDADRVLRTGAAQHVVFATTADLLATVWSEAIALDAWLAAGITVTFAEPTPLASPEALASLAQSWHRWHHRQRRRQIIGGLLLSLAALAAAFAVLTIR